LENKFINQENIMKTSKHNNFTTSLNYDPEIEDIINSFVTLTGVAYKEAARYI